MKGAASTIFLPLVVGPIPETLLKRGVVKSSTCAHVRKVGASWTCTYSPEPANCSIPTQGGIYVESVPMIRDASQMQDHVGGNSEWILGFNEPDGVEPYGSGIQADDAAALWQQIEAWFPSKRLVAPSPSSAAVWDSANWVHDFRASFLSANGRNPRLDALNVHIYFDCAAMGIGAVSGAIEHAQEWGIPEVWVTEMGMPWTPPTTETLAQMRQFMNWLNMEPMVTRYAWFATYIPAGAVWYPAHWQNLSLVTEAGQLTAWGKEYVRC